MKRFFMSLLLTVALVFSTSVSLADIAPPPDFCADYEATCGEWPDDSDCSSWWYAASVGAETDTSGATQGCYAYHLAVAGTAAVDGNTEDVLAHCAHAIGGEDADGNAPCTDATSVPDPIDYDACADKVCGDICSKCDPADTDCIEEDGQFCDMAGECLGTGVDSPPDCDDVTDPPPVGGPFSVNECWDEMCAAQTVACKAEPDCAAYNECYKVSDVECQQALADANPDAVQLHQDLRECGWQSCNDPSAGSCADPGKEGAENRCGQWDDNWPCNCDEACTQFNDCCNDFNDVCGAGGGGSGGGDGPCIPQCIGKSCGPDTCGGSCGDCQAGQACSASGVCEATCEDACLSTEPGSCEGSVATLCAQNPATGCLELTTSNCAADGGTCAGEGVCIPGPGDGTEPGAEAPGEDGALGDDGEDDEGGSGGSGSAGCAGGPASTGTPFLLLLGLALMALIRRRTIA